MSAKESVLSRYEDCLSRSDLLCHPHADHPLRVGLLCHPERSEGSHTPVREILRYAQDDIFLARPRQSWRALALDGSIR